MFTPRTNRDRRLPFSSALLVSALSALFACGGGQDEADVDPSPSGSTGAGPGLARLAEDTPMYRVDVEVGETTATILEVSRRTLPAGYVRPVPWMGGGSALVAWNGEEVVEALPLRFLPEVLFEAMADGVPAGRTVVPTDSSVTTVWIAAEGVDRLEVLGPDGSSLDAMNAADLSAASRAVDQPSIELEIRGLDESLGTEDSAHPSAIERSNMAHGLLPEALAAEFPHIRLLMPGEGDLLPEAMRPGTDWATGIVVPTDEAVQRVVEALRVTAPGPRAAMSTLAFVDMPNQGYVPIPEECEGIATSESQLYGAAGGTAMVLNAAVVDGSGSADRYVVHETMHNLTAVLDGNVVPGSIEAKPPAVRSYLERLREDYRVQFGYQASWIHTHGTAVELGHAAAFTGGLGCTRTNAQAVDMGFATAYGSSQPLEDIAEFASAAQIDGDDDLLCDRFRAYTGDDFPVDLAIHFVKLHMLKSVEAIDTDRFEQCVGSVKIDAPTGIHLGDAISFTRSLQAGFYEPDGVPYFAVLGEGPETYGFLMRVHSPNYALPLGLHPLNSILALNVGATQNGAYLTHEANSRARASGGGMVLFTEINEDEVRGAIFFLSLQNAFGTPTDRFAYSPFVVR